MPDDENAVTKHLALPAFAKRKLGPLPVYGWGIIGAGLVGGFFFMRRRNGAATPSGFQIPVYGDNSGSGAWDFGGGSAQSPGSGSGGGSGGPTAPSPTPVIPPPAPYVPPFTNPVPPAPAPAPGRGPMPETPVPAPNPPSPNPMPQPGQSQIPPKPGPNYVWDGRGWFLPYQPTSPTPPPGTPPGALPNEGGGWSVPPGVAPPPGLQGPAAGINIPQAWLTPGQFNVISSPGGTITGLEGWTAWVQNSATGQWQQYADNEYSAKGERLGLLPTGLSLPNGLNARPVGMPTE